MTSVGSMTVKQKLITCLVSIQSILNWEGKVIAPALDRFLNKGNTGGIKKWHITKSKYPKRQKVIRTEKTKILIIFITLSPFSFDGFNFIYRYIS